MRLWHQELIHYLPRQQLLGQHRECCALRGKGWGKKHGVVDYVFKHPKSWLYFYHSIVMYEMISRGYKVDYSWNCWNYCGKQLGFDTPQDEEYRAEFLNLQMTHQKCRFNDLYDCFHFKVYQEEHDNIYLLECIKNLRSKKVELVNGMSLNQFEMNAAIQGEYAP